MLYIPSGDARELNSVRFPRKNGFFSQLDAVQLFRPDSTDWEPAAIEKRNPRIRPTNSECEITRRQLCCCEEESKDRGGWRGQGKGAVWIRRKNTFALATDFFFKRGRSKYLQNRVLTGGTVFSLILIAGSTTAITVKRQGKKGYLTRGTYVDISKLY